jgi:hypothetical protein
MNVNKAEARQPNKGRRSGSYRLVVKLLPFHNFRRKEETWVQIPVRAFFCNFLFPSPASTAVGASYFSLGILAVIFYV